MENTTNFKNAILQVAKNLCYELSYDTRKNRVYFAILGFWKSPEQVPDLLSDWGKALKHVQPDFTVLTDMRTMITHAQPLNSLHEEAQLKVKAAGVLQVANVIPLDRIAGLQIESIAGKTGLPSRNFESLQEAEQWLDQALGSLA